MNDSNSRNSAEPTGSDANGSAHRHVCPWWLGWALASPVRRMIDKPEKILGPWVQPGITVLEPGCGMGFFSLPLARMVGTGGRVVAVDLQPKMIDGLKRRARKAGLLDRIEATVCGPSDLRVGAWMGKVDLALAIYVVHEIPNRDAFLAQLHAALRAGGRLLVLEPKGHVTASDFESTVAAAERTGLRRIPAAPAGRGLTAAFEK